MSLEEIEHQLYSPERSAAKKELRKRPIPEPVKSEIAEGWNDVPPRPAAMADHYKEPAPRRVYVIAALGVFTLIAGALALYLTGFGGARASIALELTVPTDVSRGVPFDFAVEASNRSELPVSGGTIEIRLPQGVRPADGDQTRAVLSAESGPVDAGAIVKQTFKLIALGDVGTVQKVTAVFVYASASGNRLEATESEEISIAKAAVSITVTVPDRIIAGSAFDAVISYRNDSESTFDDLALRVQYPSSFHEMSASPAAGSDGLWRIPKLEPEAENKITIRGFLDGTADGQAAISAALTGSAAGTEYRLAEETAGIKFSPAPVNLSILVNSRTDYVAQMGETLTYTINYENVSGIALEGAVITAKLSGPLLNAATVKTAGSFNSNTNTITWSAAQVPALRLVEPGMTGSVSVQASIVQSTQSAAYTAKNFSVKLDALFDSPSVPYYLAASSTSAAASLETRVGGNITVTSAAYYRDAAFPTPSGPFPPKVGQATRYSIRWTLKNTATDAHNVTIRASLLGGAVWANSTKVSEGTIAYDARTEEVVWTIEKVPAMKGVLTNPAEAVFQIDATPSVTNVGRYLSLISDTVAAGIDDFTGISLGARASALTTDLKDASVASGSGRVLP